MKYCSSCCHASDNGVLGPQPTCLRTQTPKWWGDVCDAWEEDTRTFAERYPDYPHLHKESFDAMKHVIASRVEQGAEVVEIQPGLRMASPPESAAKEAEAKQLMLGEL